MNAESHALIRRLTEMWKWLASPPIEPVDDSSDWYGGLAVDPESFSKQLINLQTSLRQERIHPKAVERAEIEYGSESAA